MKAMYAGTNEIYRYGKEAVKRAENWLTPNERGYYSIPVNGGKFWEIGTSVGKYGEFCKINGTIFSVNGGGFAYAKKGTEKGDAFVAAINSMIAKMNEMNQARLDALKSDEEREEEKMEETKMPYGYVNGEAVYSRDEFIEKKRGFKDLATDEELIAFAEKASHGWYESGWKQTFTGFYLSDYALSEPYASLKITEFERLKELQKQAREEQRKAEEAREWKYDHTIYWADNSEEEIWIDKDGNKKSVMTVYPHGDAC